MQPATNSKIYCWKCTLIALRQNWTHFVHISSFCHKSYSEQCLQYIFYGTCWFTKWSNYKENKWAAVGCKMPLFLMGSIQQQSMSSFSLIWAWSCTAYIYITFMHKHMLQLFYKHGNWFALKPYCRSLKKLAFMRKRFFFFFFWTELLVFMIWTFSGRW